MSRLKADVVLRFSSILSNRVLFDYWRLSLIVRRGFVWLEDVDLSSAPVNTDPSRMLDWTLAQSWTMA